MLALLLACADPHPHPRPSATDSTSTTWQDRPPDASAYVIEINEWMPATLAAARDEGGRVADWVEIVNLGPEDAVIDGW